jgi:riboflavin kinase
MTRHSNLNRELQSLSLREKVLIYLAETGAITNSLKITTPILSRQFNTSQQSASRLLIILEKEGLIERRVVGRVSYVKLTQKGISRLLDLYLSLRLIFERPVKISMEGRVFTGYGEGSYYMSLPGYVRQMEEKLGFIPYPGTLNVSLLSKDSIENKLLLQKYAEIEISGFKDEHRTYGPVKAVHVLVNDCEHAVAVFPERTLYDSSVIELVAAENLRQKLELKDGSLIRISATLPPKVFYEGYKPGVSLPQLPP